MTATAGAAPPLARPEPWDLVSSGYTRDLAPHCEKYAADALACVPLPPGAQVLDVATGPGTLALVAARRGLAVSAVDFSSDMIALLATRARTAGLAAQITARVGDGHALPFPDASFAAAFSIFGLMFFADPARGLTEMRRVVRAGGAVAITTWTPLEEMPAIGALFAALRRAAPELTIPPAPAPLGRADELHDAMAGAGLVGVAVHTTEHALVYDSAAHLWAAFASSAAPIALVRQRVGATRFRAISAAAVTELSTVLGPGALQVPMPAYVGVAHRRR